MTVAKPRTLEDMAARLPPERAAFAALHDRLRPPESSDFKTISILRPRVPGETKEARNCADMLAALRCAREEGWLHRFTQDALGALTGDAALIIELQAITNPKVDFDHIGDVNVGVLRAMRRCCRIVCGDDGDAVRGSGFLIGPQLVLTNWHVVRSQIEAEEAAAKADRPRPPVTVHVEFDSFRNRDGTIAPPVVERVTDRWLVVSSDDGLQEMARVGAARPLPANLEILKKRMDFAVLDLTNPVGYERGWYELKTDLPSPEPDAPGVLIQFPGNYAMRVTAGPYLREPALPGRICHSMNAIGGSSGGLCATSAFEPLALHQGSLRLGRRHDAVEQRELVIGDQNVAIPLGLIALLAGEQISLRAREAPARVHRNALGQPIVGRHDLQRAIHASIYGDNRIIVVRNNYDSDTGQLKNGIGKSFTISILEAMTRPGDTLIRIVSAAELTADPFAAARAIAAAFRRATTDSAALAVFAEVEAAAPRGETTAEAEVRALADTLVGGLRIAAGERILWLVIDDLDRHPVDSDGQTANLLNRLYDQISVEQRLRAMLIGPSPGLMLPEGLKARSEGPLGEISPAEIEQWIALARGTDRPFDRDHITMLRQMVLAIVPGWHPQERLSRTTRIAQILADVVGPQLA